MSSDTTDRLDRLESLVERQSETIAGLREEVAALRGDSTHGDARDAPVSRRTALRAGGILALLGIGSGVARADPQGQVGTSSDPLHALYTQTLAGPLTGGTDLTDLVGSGLTINSGTLEAIDTSAWADGDGDDLLEPADSSVIGVESVSTVQSASGNALTFHTDDGVRTLELDVPSSDGTVTAGGNVVAGHPNNAVNNDAVGVVIGGGGATNGNENSVGGNYATVGGGITNTANGARAAVGGGDGNTASGHFASVGGGDGNTASGEVSAVGGGSYNEASGAAATIGGGDANTASENFTTVGGGGGNTASGAAATVAGGVNNTASGDYSFAAGREADTNGHAGAFVFGDSGGTRITADNEDEVRFQHEQFFVGEGNLPSGTGTALIYTSSGEVVRDSSSARYKTNIQSLSPDPGAVLELEPREFEYEGRGERGVGLIAEEVDDHLPDLVNTDAEGRPDSVNYDRLGVYLIPEVRRHREEITDLKAENERLRERNDDQAAHIEDQETETADLRAENHRLRERNAELEARLDRVEAHLGVDADNQRGVAGD